MQAARPRRKFDHAAQAGLRRVRKHRATAARFAGQGVQLRTRAETAGKNVLGAQAIYRRALTELPDAMKAARERGEDPEAVRRNLLETAHQAQAGLRQSHRVGKQLDAHATIRGNKANGQRALATRLVESLGKKVAADNRSRVAPRGWAARPRRQDRR